MSLKLKDVKGMLASKGRYGKEIRLYSVLCVLFFIVFVISATTCVMGCFNDHTATFTVTEKERMLYGESNSKYLVFGELSDGTVVVYENTDNFLRSKFNSSNIYGELKVGETYTVNLVGYRIAFMSNYENILSIIE